MQDLDQVLHSSGVALHKAVLQKLAEKGGKVPADLRG